MFKLTNYSGQKSELASKIVNYSEMYKESDYMY